MLSASEAAFARAVLIHGPISRGALTDRLGLSPASLTRLARPFLDRGLVVELPDPAEGAVGRPVRPLDIAPGLGRFGGVKITGDRVYAVATDVRAAVLAEYEHALSDTSPAGVARAVEDALAQLGPEPLSGVGVSLGGNVLDDVVVHAPFLHWDEVRFADIMTERIGVPVTLENDVVALAEAERWFGCGRGIPGFILVTIGAGLGYVLVIEGEVIRSPEVGLSLVSHLRLTSAGGVELEAGEWLSSDAVAARASEALGHAVSYDELLALAEAGEPAARVITDAAADVLGRLLAIATSLTLQPAVVLAGEGIGLMAVAGDRVRAAMDVHRHPHAGPVELFLDESGFPAWARGAAAVAIQAAVARIRFD